MVQMFQSGRNAHITGACNRGQPSCSTAAAWLLHLPVFGAQPPPPTPHPRPPAGVGFTDVGSGTPGTDSSQFTSAHFDAWRPAFFARLAAQAVRASAAVPGCTCSACGAPLVVAFSGKRQFVELFPAAKTGSGRRGGSQKAAAAAAGGGERAEGSDAPCAGSGSSGDQRARLPTLQARRPSSVATGRQWVLPEGWPLPLSTEVGAASC